MPLCQSEARPGLPVSLQARAWLSPGYLRQEHRQPDCHNLVSRNDARFSWGDGDAKYLAVHDAIVKAIEALLVAGPVIPDLGGKANTTDVGKALAALLA